MKLIAFTLFVLFTSTIEALWTREGLTAVYTHDFIEDIIADYDFNSPSHRANLSIPLGLVNQTQYEVISVYGDYYFLTPELTCYKLIIPSNGSVLTSYSTVQATVNSHSCVVFDSDLRLLTTGLKDSNYSTMWINCPDGLDQYRELSEDISFYTHVALADHCTREGYPNTTETYTISPIPYDVTNTSNFWENHIKPDYLEIPCPVDYSNNVVGSFILIDTGIDYTHPEFAGTGRARPLGTSTSGSPNGVYSDSLGTEWVGHGTIIAAILAGKELSIFNNSIVYGAKVFNGDGSLSHDGLSRAYNEAVFEIGTGIIQRPVMVVTSIIYKGDIRGCLNTDTNYDVCFNSAIMSMQKLFDLGVVVADAAGNGFPPFAVEAACEFCGYYYNISQIYYPNPYDWSIPQRLDQYFREQIFDPDQIYQYFYEYNPIPLLDAKKPVMISGYRTIDGDIPFYFGGSANYGDYSVEFAAPSNITTYALVNFNETAGDGSNTKPYFTSLEDATFYTSFSNGVGATYVMSVYYITGIDGITWNGAHTDSFIDYVIDMYTVPHTTVNEHFAFTGVQSDTINTTNLLFPCASGSTSGTTGTPSVTTGIPSVTTGSVPPYGGANLTCNYKFENPNVPYFTLPQAQPNSPGDVSLSNGNNIVLANGNQLNQGQGCNSNYAEYWTGSTWSSTFVNTLGQSRNLGDIFYTNQNQLYVRTIQQDDSNLSSILSGKCVRLWITCNNGYSGCLPFCFQ